jgi:hypothetical protein
MGARPSLVGHDLRGGSFKKLFKRDQQLGGDRVGASTRIRTWGAWFVAHAANHTLGGICASSSVIRAETRLTVLRVRSRSVGGSFRHSMRAF